MAVLGMPCHASSDDVKQPWLRGTGWLRVQGFRGSGVGFRAQGFRRLGLGLLGERFMALGFGRIF